jgi:Gram-negative bacterial TonB protein C-terminal
MKLLGMTTATVFFSLLCSAPVNGESPPDSDNTNLLLYRYDMCLDHQLSLLIRPNLANPKLYSLIDLADDDAAKLIKTQCAESRSQLLSEATDPGKARQVFDALVTDREQRILANIARVRPILNSTVESYNVRGPRPAVPLTERGITADDYPASALRNREQGKSTATFTVGTDGRVSECTATGAPESLNTTTCWIIQKRWRYAPALDKNNQPISETRTKSIVFLMQ